VKAAERRQKAALGKKRKMPQETEGPNDAELVDDIGHEMGDADGLDIGMS